MQSAAFDKELLALEKPTATRLSDDRCIVVGPQGISEIDRQALAGMVEAASYELAT